jgi:outer membrane protein TolC
MLIRFFIVAAIALAFILPIANYAKGLDLKDRPAFLRRIEEKLAVLLSGFFVAKDKNNQIDYGQNIGHEPVPTPIPPKAAAKKQHSKPNYSLGPRILKQVWIAETQPQAGTNFTSESDTGLKLEPLLAIKENDVDTAQLEIAQLEAKPEPSAETNPDTQQPQLAEQEPQQAAQEPQQAAQEPQQAAQEPQLAAQEPQLAAMETAPTEQEPAEVIVQPEWVAFKPEEEPVEQLKTQTQTAAANDPSLSAQASTQVQTTSQTEPEVLAATGSKDQSIQAQLAAQQTIEQLETYARQKQAEQDAKDLIEQQRLQALQQQVQQQQALAETVRLQEEQRLWVQAAEETSRIMAAQKQVLEDELQRQKVLRQAELAFKAKVKAEQEALEQLALEQQAQLQAQAEQARLAAIEAQREELRQSFAKAESDARARIAKETQDALDAKEAAEAKRMAELKQQADEMRQALAARQQQEKQAEELQAQKLAQQAKAEKIEAQRLANAAQLALARQAKAEKLEAQRLAKAQQLEQAQQAKAQAELDAQQELVQLGKAAVEAKRMAELKQQADEMRQSLAAMKEAEEAKRMADLKKKSDQMRESLAAINKEQQLQAEAAKATTRVVTEQMANANISAGEVEFINHNKLTELVESMDPVSQGKSKSKPAAAKSVDSDKAVAVDKPVSPNKQPKTQAPVVLADKDGEMNWTSMPPASDLPPQIAKMGESFIDTVFKQLPSSKKMAKSMPFDEFKWRIKEAIDTSPDIAVVSNLAEQSKTSKSLAMSSLLPQVTGTSDSGKRTIKNPWLDTSLTQDGSNFGITVSQLVFDFGATMFGLKAGKARVKAAEELLMSKKSEQALKSINAFIELERARDQHKLATQNAQSRLELTKLVKERFALGGGTKPDVIRAESRYAEALSTVAMTSSKVSAAEATYRELFASNPTGVVVGPDHEFVIDGLNKSAEELAGTYPGLLQLARLKDAASEESKAIIAKTLPSFNLVYSNTSQGHFVANVNPASSSSLVLQMSVPLYDGGAGAARKDDARLKAKQTELEFDAALRSFEKILLQNQAEVKNSEEILTSRSVSVRSSIASMRAVREQFAFNKGTLLDLISVQDSLYQSGRDMIDANADRHLARYRLAHLTSELQKVFLLSDTPLALKD